jgi:type I restriction enzyme M protein
MSNEELNQRRYLATGRLKGDKFGDFEELNIGSTSVRELKAVGVNIIIPAEIEYPWTLYKAPKRPGSAKPDRVFLRRQNGVRSASLQQQSTKPRRSCARRRSY